MEAALASDRKVAVTFTTSIPLFTIRMLNSHFSSQPQGADLPDHNQLGSGVSHPGPRAGQSDVQPAKEAV